LGKQGVKGRDIGDVGEEGTGRWLEKSTMRHKPDATYNIPFSAESVDTEDALKAGQVVEPCRDTQDSAIAVGVLRAAKAANKIVLLDGHVLLRRGFPINLSCTFIAL
jgi:hypothetical protein